jgi:hypothetical protein
MLKFWSIVLLVLGALLIVLSCINLLILHGAFTELYVIWIVQGIMQIWGAIMILRSNYN